MVLRNLTRVRHERGFCWVTQLHTDIVPGDTEGVSSRSVLRLFEGEIELGSGHSLHESIRQTGNGLFSHWENHLFFSTSDNSNPCTNGRIYRVLTPLKSDEGKPETNHGPCDTAITQPINYQPPLQRLDRITDDAEYAVTCARSYVAGIPGGRNGLQGRTVLEIGPGPSFATALILKAWGASTVVVSDKYLVRFNPQYHGALYREIAKRLLTEDDTTDVTALEKCSQAGHIQEHIRFCELALEEMKREFSGFFDITLSNAVLEHLYSPNQAIAGLYAIMANGGFGLHQVDFRDHRNFDRPLEYLLLDEMSFAQLFGRCHGECGNRIRPFQMEWMFRQAGFKDVAFQTNLEVTSEYLADFLQRLKMSPISLFARIDTKALIPIGGRFVVRK